MKKQNEWRKILSAGGRILLYGIFAFLPVLWLILTGPESSIPIMNERKWGLLEQSVRIAVSSCFLCLLIAFFGAMGLYQLFPKRRHFRWFFLLLAPLPAYIYALTYMNLIRFFGTWIPSLLRSPIAGLFPCILVETMAYLPFATACALIALEQVNTGEWKAALLMEKGDGVFFRVLLPGQLPYLLAMGAVIFVLSVTDYSIPSLFQVNVYAMEIFSDYSAMGNSLYSLKLSLPLIVVAVAVTLPCLLPLRTIRRPMTAGEIVNPCLSPALKGICYLGVLVLVLQILLPILSLLPFLVELAKAFVPAGRELLYSGESGILAVLILTPVAAQLALLLAKKRSTLLWIVTLLPLSIPGVLSGIGVCRMFSDLHLSAFRNGLFMPAVGMAIRYLPFSVIIQFGAYLRMDKDKLSAAYLLQGKKGGAFFRVQLFMMRPGLLISGIVVFLLMLGDVGTALMLMQPGREPLSVKIYNYLHYGASETVAVFCLLQILCCLVGMGLIYLFLERKKTCWK
ncbi:MAG: hypothetical protein K6A92_11540 [Lachnospiraceae bacterium]|nr:hypothetical protein [Lachnospiraceae bacterium]